MIIKSKIRRWGNSFGILIPKDFIKKRNFSENENVLVDLKKKKNLQELFGICSFKRPVKEIMREIKDGYDD